MNLDIQLVVQMAACTESGSAFVCLLLARSCFSPLASPASSEKE